MVVCVIRHDSFVDVDGTDADDPVGHHHRGNVPLWIETGVSTAERCHCAGLCLCLL